MNGFVIHACEQVLRFTKVDNWDDLSDERKVQLSFNMGVFALGLNLSKEDGYDSIAGTAKGNISIHKLHQHLRDLIDSKGIVVDEDKVNRPV